MKNNPYLSNKYLMHLKDKIRLAEFAYLSCFSTYTEDRTAVRFRDEQLPDMYMHNLTQLKKHMDADALLSFIASELEEARQSGKTFLHIMLDEMIDEKTLEKIHSGPQITYYLFMTAPVDHYRKIPLNPRAVVKPADDDQTYDDGRLVDLESNAPATGEDFAKRKSSRKANAFRQHPNLSLYVCYAKDKPVGKCEMLVDREMAKMEDFDVLEQYRGQGYGSAIMRRMMEDAMNAGARTFYLMTESDNTAREMYEKYGFTTRGYRTSLLFFLS